VTAFRHALPGERERRRGAVAAAEERVAEAQAAHERAEQEVARAEQRGREQERANAARAAAEAAEDLRVAAAELARGRDAVAALEAEADQVAAEAEAIEREAATTAARLSELPRLAPVGSPDDVEDWGARARAALLVLHGSLASERDAIVREANELGSALIGEPLGAVSVAGVRERVARALAGGPP
jgi:hypothetical protein